MHYKNQPCSNNFKTAGLVISGLILSILFIAFSFNYARIYNGPSPQELLSHECYIYIKIDSLFPNVDENNPDEAVKIELYNELVSLQIKTRELYYKFDPIVMSAAGCLLVSLVVVIDSFFLNVYMLVINFHY